MRNEIEGAAAVPSAKSPVPMTMGLRDHARGEITDGFGNAMLAVSFSRTGVLTPRLAIVIVIYRANDSPGGAVPAGSTGGVRATFLRAVRTVSTCLLASWRRS